MPGGGKAQHTLRPAQRTLRKKRLLWGNGILMWGNGTQDAGDDMGRANPKQTLPGCFVWDYSLNPSFAIYVMGKHIWPYLMSRCFKIFGQFEINIMRESIYTTNV